MASLNYINRSLKNYDSCLYAVEHKLGRFDIYRKSKFMLQSPHFLFSLTDSWKPSGVPVQYGVEVILSRIKAHDLWRDDSFVENFIKEQEKAKLSKDNDRRNSTEAFLYEFHSQFKKTFSDVNTSNLKKLYRGENHGYCEPRLRR